jgi:hypothetical protein
MEEVTVAHYVCNPEGRYERVVEKRLQRKNQTPKATYRGIKIFTKTPVSLRGKRVSVTRTEMRGSLNNTAWMIKEDKKTVAYAAEIYLENVSLSLKDGQPVVSGIVVSPSEELRLLTTPLAIKDGRIVPLTACANCMENMVEHVNFVKMTKSGVFTSL